MVFSLLLLLTFSLFLPFFLRSYQLSRPLFQSPSSISHFQEKEKEVDLSNLYFFILTGIESPYGSCGDLGTLSPSSNNDIYNIIEVIFTFFFIYHSKIPLKRLHFSFQFVTKSMRKDLLVSEIRKNHFFSSTSTRVHVSLVSLSLHLLSHTQTRTRSHSQLFLKHTITHTYTHTHTLISINYQVNIGRTCDGIGEGGRRIADEVEGIVNEWTSGMTGERAREKEREKERKRKGVKKRGTKGDGEEYFGDLLNFIFSHTLDTFSFSLSSMRRTFLIYSLE